MSSISERFIEINNNFNKGFLKNDQDNKYREEEIHLFLPFSDLNGWIYENDQIYKTYEVFAEPISRLSEIKCLSFLTYIDTDIDPKDQYFYRPSHTRDCHTHVVAATGAAILMENNISDLEIKKYLSGGYLHDLATPALGDATKFIDNRNLHEELFWQEMLDKNSKKYLEEIPVTIEEIDSIIKNEGILGEILDIADRITYVCQDLHNLSPSPRKDLSKTKDLKNKLSKFLLINPNIGDIYKDVRIENNEVYFNNVDRLHNFLYVRALLHKQVYMHPINQGRDFIVASKIKEFYNKDAEDTLTPTELRQMNDCDLLNYLADKNEVPRFKMEMLLDQWKPNHYEKFNDLESAQKRSDELEKDNQKVFGIKECRGFNAATKYKVKDKSGNIVTYHDYNPQGAAVIEKIAKKTKGFFLYY